MIVSHLWQSAAAFSARAHRAQLRRDNTTPYASHPVRVALTVACVFGFTDETLLASALLHDVIEDCDVDYDDLHELFSMEVADIVACLSKDMRLIEPKREIAYDAQLAAGPWQARLIKLADVYDNLSDAETDASRQALLPRTLRALALAEGQEELADASLKVRNLMKKVEAELTTSS